MTGIRDTDFSGEFEFVTSRSGGPGGQNVNKVNSKVELRFDVKSSLLLNETQKAIIATKLSSKMTDDGLLIIVSQRERSQLANKEDAIAKFYALIELALKPVKPRRTTAPTRSSIEKRLTEKRVKSETKQGRQKPIQD